MPTSLFYLVLGELTIKSGSLGAVFVGRTAVVRVTQPIPAAVRDAPLM